MSETAFPVASLDPKLQRVERYWRSLIRGANDMPFWDDFAPSALSGEDVMLLNVFDKPLRFRFDSVVSPAIEARYGQAVRDRFSDEVKSSTPFELLNEQAASAVETGKPTLHHERSYRRLLLPMWGDGRVSMLLGAFSWS
ncbi:MAG TPA: hypothetical protein VHC73_08865 [Vitreimonas sp.]|nr:hypothetical protein [Vitreimonas sp.]